MRIVGRSVINTFNEKNGFTLESLPAFALSMPDENCVDWSFWMELRKSPPAFFARVIDLIVDSAKEVLQ